MIAAASMASLAFITGAFALVLTSFGLRKGVLRMRPGPRRCPSCGRRLRSWACWACTQARDG
jgi:hypothetical protein